MAARPAHRKENAWITSKTTGAKNARRTGALSRRGLLGRVLAPHKDKAPHRSVRHETSREAKEAARLAHIRTARVPPVGPAARDPPEGTTARDLLEDPRAQMGKGPHADPTTVTHAVPPQGPQAPPPRIAPHRTATSGRALPTPTPQAANLACPSRPCRLASALAALWFLAS